MVEPSITECLHLNKDGKSVLTACQSVDPETMHNLIGVLKLCIPLSVNR